MSRTLTPIQFFSDEITIVPHTATSAHHIGKPISIREFADGCRVRLERDDDTGEYIVTNVDQHLIAPGMPNLFIEGPEVQHA